MRTSLNIFVLATLINLRFSVDIFAQQREFSLEHITVDAGLSQNTIRCIIQDKQGFMWFGTDDGLNRFDGYSFVIYRHDEADSNSLSDNSITAFHLDNNGILWIGTWHGGLNKFNSETGIFTQYKHDPANPSSLSNDYVKEIHDDESGNLWIGTEGGGLNKFDMKNGRFTHYRHDPSNPNSLSDDRVWAIEEDGSGMLWLGTYGGGLDRFDRESGRFKHYKHNPSEPNNLGDDRVIALYEDNSGTLWIGTQGGLDKFNRATGEFKHYTHDPSNANSVMSGGIGTIYEDGTGMLFFGGIDLSLFDQSTGTFRNYGHDPNNPSSLSYSTVTAIYEDLSGTLWIGTALQGLNKYSRYKQKFTYYSHQPNNPNSLSSNNVRSILQDHEGILWVGADGLNRLDRMTGEVKHYDYNPHAIFEDSFGQIWIGTGVLSKFDPRSESFTHYKHNSDDPKSLTQVSIAVIYEDRAGTIWVGSTGGLNRFDRKTESFMRYNSDETDPTSLSDNHVQAIYEDRSGKLWIGTWNGGLNRFDRGNENFDRFMHDLSEPNSISHNTVHSIWEDDKGYLWIATRGGGLNKFDPTKEIFTHFRGKEGLPDDWIYAVLGDKKGNLWLSSNRGITKFNPESGEVRNYSVDDGLQSNEFNYGVAFKSPTGEMFFGGINGFNAFYPEQVLDNTVPPEIAISSFKVLDEPMQYHTGIESKGAIELSHEENFFSFEFVALHYTNPQRNQYAYMLEGLDKNWVKSGTVRSARYTDVAPGDYTFRVKASNSDGIWNEKGISVNIRISPPFWKTWWAYLIYTILIAGALFEIDEVQRRRLKKRAERDAEEKIKIEKVKANEREKIYTQAAADFHDQVSGEVGIINMFSELLRLNTETNGDPAAVNHLEKIIRSSRKLADFKDSFVWILESGEIELHDLLDYLKERGYEIFSNTSVEFKSISDLTKERELILPIEWNRNLTFIFIEAMSNALNHSECKNVVFEVKIEDRKLEISITDDGKGIGKDVLKGRGLQNMRRRAKELGGELDIISDSEEKTSILFTGNIPHLGD